METLLTLIILVFAISFLVDKLTGFFDKFKLPENGNPLNSGKKVCINCTISTESSEEQKREVRTTHITNSTQHDNLDQYIFNR